MGTNKVCSFFGHRKIVITETIKQRIRTLLENLIIQQNVTIFLFGSRSEFNDLCHLIVTELKTQYRHIERVAYTCKNESCTLESEKQKWETIHSHFLHQANHLLVVEKELESKTKYTACKASYVERNQAMIDDSDYCVFYYDEKYQPAIRKYAKYSITKYQPKSGTKLAYNYAKQKRKIVFNLAQL